MLYLLKKILTRTKIKLNADVFCVPKIRRHRISNVGHRASNVQVPTFEQKKSRFWTKQVLTFGQEVVHEF